MCRDAAARGHRPLPGPQELPQPSVLPGPSLLPPVSLAATPGCDWQRQLPRGGPKCLPQPLPGTRLPSRRSPRRAAAAPGVPAGPGHPGHVRIRSLILDSGIRVPAAGRKAPGAAPERTPPRLSSLQGRPLHRGREPGRSRSPSPRPGEGSLRRDSGQCPGSVGAYTWSRRTRQENLKGAVWEGGDGETHSPPPGRPAGRDSRSPTINTAPTPQLMPALLRGGSWRRSQHRGSSSPSGLGPGDADTWLPTESIDGALAATLGAARNASQAPRPCLPRCPPGPRCCVGAGTLQSRQPDELPARVWDKQPLIKLLH